MKIDKIEITDFTSYYFYLTKSYKINVSLVTQNIYSNK